MLLCSAIEISKSYSEKKLIENVTFYIQEGEKVGVVGINGAGKSTFLKIIAGRETPDSGTVTLLSGARVGYLPQNPVFEENTSVLEQVFKGASETFRELKDYEAKTILTKLGFTDFSRDASMLSGGEKRRVALAAVLVNPCEFLILDEPTNHLDSDMVSWLEKQLTRFTGAILMVTHDRYFLDRVSNRIVEIDNGSLFSYDANYSKYLELKAEREAMDAGSERKRQSFLKRELEWIQRGPRARGTKARARIDRFERVRDAEGPASSSSLKLQSVSSRLGKKTVELSDISKSIDGRQLIRDFSYSILRDDRIGIIGPNGCGKTTLLKIIMGEVIPDSGTVEIGDTVKIGYFSQENEDMNPDARVIDYIRDIAEYVETVEGTVTASQMLEKFLFPPDLQWNSIGRLSGGERRRLLLLKTLMAAPNILFLDEPTNDLDIMTLMVLEEYLEGFSGPVITVSHDRYFLDKVADKIFAFREDGGIKAYIGGYTDYLKAAEEEEPKPQTVKKQQDKAPAPAQEKKKTKFTYKEQKEFETIDDDIATLEDEIAAAKNGMEASASDYVRLTEFMEKKAALEKQLQDKMERWVYLNELAEQFEKEK